MTAKASTHLGNIAIFRALQLGDMLCAIPAMRALRVAFSQSKITLVGLPWAIEFANRYSDLIDDFIAFPGYPGLPEQPYDADRFLEFLGNVRICRFDLAIQMHGSGLITNPLVASFGSKRVAGFHAPLSYVPDAGLFVRYPDKLHEIDRHLALAEHLGAASRGKHVDFPQLSADVAEFKKLHAEYRLLNDQYICIHPGARSAGRRWGAVNFATIGDLVADRGYRVVLTGTAQESEIVRDVKLRMKSAVVDLAGKTSLGTLAELIRHARLLVANDTGVSHLAAAVTTPSVVVFTGSDPNRWAPMNSVLHRVISPIESKDTSLVRQVVMQQCAGGAVQRAIQASCNAV